MSGFIERIAIVVKKRNLKLFFLFQSNSNFSSMEIQKLPFASKLGSKMFRDVECASKTCFEEEVFQEECVVYVGDKPNCDPPCFVDGCSTEIEFNQLCEVWICEDKIKTTTPTTTSTSNYPSSTAPSSLPEPGLMTSIVFNLIALIAIMSLTIALIVIVRRNRTQTPIPLPVPRQNLGSASEIQSLNPAIMVDTSPSAPPAEDSDNGSVSVR